MSSATFRIADTAKLQIAQLPQQDMRALREFFRGDIVASSKAAGNGMLVGRVGQRRVLWKRGPGGKPVVLSVVDASYAQRA